MSKQVILDWNEYKKLEEKVSIHEWAAHQIIVYQDKVVVGDTVATQQFEMDSFGSVFEIIATIKKIK